MGARLRRNDWINFMRNIRGQRIWMKSRMVRKSIDNISFGGREIFINFVFAEIVWQ